MDNQLNQMPNPLILPGDHIPGPRQGHYEPIKEKAPREGVYEPIKEKAPRRAATQS